MFENLQSNDNYPRPYTQYASSTAERTLVVGSAQSANNKIGAGSVFSQQRPMTIEASPHFDVVDANAPKDTAGEKTVADPTREEFDAKLATVEARLEARLVGIDGKLDRIGDQVANFASISGVKMDGLADQAREAKAAAQDAKSAAGAIKWHIFFYRSGRGRCPFGNVADLGSSY